MTHATVTPYDSICCVISFAYDKTDKRSVTTKDAVKSLPGTEFYGGAWVVPILHLPLLKDIFVTMTVVPEVVTAYHDLLKRMLQDFGGQPPADIRDKHAIGIAHISASGWQPTPRPQYMDCPEPVPAEQSELANDDPQLGLLIRSLQGAQVRQLRTDAIVARQRRQWTKA